MQQWGWGHVACIWLNTPLLFNTSTVQLLEMFTALFFFFLPWSCTWFCWRFCILVLDFPLPAWEDSSLEELEAWDYKGDYSLPRAQEQSFNEFSSQKPRKELGCPLIPTCLVAGSQSRLNVDDCAHRKWLKVSVLAAGRSEEWLSLLMILQGSELTVYLFSLCKPAWFGIMQISTFLLRRQRIFIKDIKDQAGDWVSKAVPCTLKDRKLKGLREWEIDWKANYKPISALGLRAGK